MLLKKDSCVKTDVAVVKCFSIWKNMRKHFKTFPQVKFQVHSQIEAWKQ